MNELEILKKLAAAAAREEVPQVRVGSRPIEIPTAAEDDFSRPLVWIAGFASAMALPAIIFAVYTLDSWTDPLLGVIDGLNWILS
ncbi:MAG TPA: hypothetical protein VMC85_11705 [Desulfomonilaceae bacterium]|nr:hypothetical protein [Desulfomonilaceae bacterium]